MPRHIGDPVVQTERTDGHVIITSLPKFLGLIGYQICLAMVLRWRAPLKWYVPLKSIKHKNTYVHLKTI